MPQAYCIKCKSKVDVKNGVRATYSNGTPVEKGTCAICGSKVTRILTKEERTAIKNEQMGETGQQAKPETGADNVKNGQA